MRTPLRALVVLVLAVSSLLLSAPAHAAPARHISYTEWVHKADFRTGTLAGTRIVRGKLRLGDPVGHRRHRGRPGGRRHTYDVGRWTSPWTVAGYGLTELVPSWDATTRKDSWVQIRVRGRTPHGRVSSWDTIANWAPQDRGFHRTSLGPQRDDLARVNVDTWRANGHRRFTRWQLRVVLLGRSGTNATPFVDTVGAMTSRLPDVSSVATSRPGVARGTVLDVPRYSQMTHRGEYPEYGGGGEAWCSPTSTSMVLGYDHALPAPSDYSWVHTSSRHPFVDHAARMTYDYRYGGTGNWPFNTAYAASRTNHAFVTRLRSLRQAERLVAHHIPVVASIAFGYGELDGAPISASNGHLVVIVGFTSTGDVVVNDPAARHDRGVRRVYDRGQFENAWLPSSGGLAYIIRTRHQHLPRHASNW